MLRPRFSGGLVLLFLSLASGPGGLASPRSAEAAPTRGVHEIEFFVHQCLIDADGLLFYQDLLTHRLAQASTLLEGEQGGGDVACCAELEPVSVQRFGSCGDGLDILTTTAEVNAVFAMGPGAYLVEAIQACGGAFSSAIRGCGFQPGNRFIVGLDAESDGILTEVVTHERGHNIGLGHVAGDPCNLMAAANGGGCLSAAECSTFAAKADSAFGTCACLPDTLGDPVVADGNACVENGGCETCSGGLCSACAAGSERNLLSAGDPGFPGAGTPDEPLCQSFVSGGWSSKGSFGAGITITGMAYDPTRNTVFAVQSLPGDDQLVRLDPVDGTVSQTVGTIPFGAVQALAYDPSDDLLFAIHLDAEIFGDPYPCGSRDCVSSLLAIDPDDAATTELGELNYLIVPRGVEGLAFDSVGGVLFGSTLAGLFVIDVDTCTGIACQNTSQVDSVYRDTSSLAYDPVANLLVRQGGDGSGAMVLDRISPITGLTLESVGISPFTAGGSAAVPVPEPGATSLLTAGASTLGLLARRARRR